MDNQLQTPQPEAQHIVAEQKKTLKLEGRMIKREGHMTFEYNYVTKKITLAEKKETNAALNAKGETIIHHKMVANPDCIYFQALNEINAWKKAFQTGTLTDQEYLSNVMRIKTRKVKVT